MAKNALSFLVDPEFYRSVRDTAPRSLGKASQGLAAATLGAPVDIANLAMRPFGLGAEKPVLGSEYIGELLGADTGDTSYKIGSMLPVGPAELAQAGTAAKAFAIPLAAALGGTAIASKASEGAKLNALANVLSKERGIFAGVNAKTADLNALARAKEMQAAGVPDADIWKQTGWALDTPDKSPRFEISDDTARFIPTRWNRPYESDLSATQATLGNAMAHDELYKAYPLLSKMDIVNNKNLGLTRGEYHAPNENIDLGEYMQLGVDRDSRLANESESAKRFLDRNDPYGLYWRDLVAESIDEGIPRNEAVMDVRNAILEARKGRDELKSGILWPSSDSSIKSTTLHELQHAIQNRENFARGGSPDSMGKVMQDRKRNAAQQLNEMRASGQIEPDKYELLMSEINSIPDNLSREQLNEGYRRLAGEAEARLTQSRMNLTPEQRLAQYPYAPEYFKGATGVNLEDLIVRKDGGVAMSAPAKTEFELAHEVAQRNAALPVEQGGLGLPPNNTAMDRAKAMGFDTPAYHGADNDITEFSPEFLGKNTGANSAKKAFFFAGHPQTTYAYMEKGVSGHDPLLRHIYGKSPEELSAINKDYQKRTGYSSMYDDEDFLMETFPKYAESKNTIDEIHRIEKMKGGLLRRTPLSEENKNKLNALIEKKKEHDAIISMTQNSSIGGDLSEAGADEVEQFIDNRLGWKKSGANITPVLLKTDNHSIFDDLGTGYREKTYAERLAEAEQAGNEGMTVLRTKDGYRDSDTVYGVFNPSNIRSRFAAFDPMQRNSANILAGGAAGAIGLNALAPYLQDESY